MCRCPSRWAWPAVSRRCRACSPASGAVRAATSLFTTRSWQAAHCCLLFRAGLLGALCGGSHYNISGPTGALSGILFRYSIVYGPQVQCYLALMTGLISMLVFVTGLDSYVVRALLSVVLCVLRSCALWRARTQARVLAVARAILVLVSIGLAACQMFLPSGVNVGFTLGVAFIIGGGQLASALGLTGNALNCAVPYNQSFADPPAPLRDAVAQACRCTTSFRRTFARHSCTWVRC